MAAGSGAAKETAKAGSISGSGDKCDSDTPAAGEMCGSWYCGVSLSTLKATVDPGAVCGGSVDTVCTGTAISVVADCGRMVKLSMPFASNDVLRPLVRECALKDAQLQQTKNACLDCIFDGFTCTADNCLAQCLGGNSKECDKCRLDAKCDQTSFACAGLPWPRS
jgi:hypothetical protein